MGVCHDEFVCDMAETYGVFDWRALPIVTAATLAQGLPASSRTARSLAGVTGPDGETMLLAVIADRLGHIAWMLSEDGSKGQNHPPSILSALTGTEAPDPEGYDSGEEFLAAWAAIGGEDDA